MQQLELYHISSLPAGPSLGIAHWDAKGRLNGRRRKHFLFLVLLLASTMSLYQMGLWL
jgi:hypothetical protein